MNAVSAVVFVCGAAAVANAQAFQIRVDVGTDSTVQLTNISAEEILVTGVDLQSPGGFLVPGSSAEPFTFHLQNDPNAIVLAVVPGAVSFLPGTTHVLAAAYQWESAVAAGEFLSVAVGVEGAIEHLPFPVLPPDTPPSDPILTPPAFPAICGAVTGVACVPEPSSGSHSILGVLLSLGFRTCCRRR